MKTIAITVIIIIALIVVFNTIGKFTSKKKSRNWFDNPKSPGKVVNIDGRDVYVTVKGRGNMTIIIEPTVGSASPEWWHIQTELEKHAKVVTYDRAGYGWSGMPQLPRTSENIAKELKKTLEVLDIAGPYILVGHALGAVYMQHFARLYSEDIAGVIFIDPQALDNTRFYKELERDVYMKSGIDKFPSIQSMIFLHKLGIIRSLKSLLFKSPPLYYYKNLSAETQDILWEHFCQESQPKMIRLEYMEGQKEGNGVRVKKAGGFPNVPVKVIYHSSESMIKEMSQYSGLAHEDAIRVEEILKQHSQQYLALSSQSEWVIAEKSCHYVHIDQPDIVIENIKKIVKDASGKLK